MELITLLSMFAALGALIRLGYEVIASDERWGGFRESPGAKRKAGLDFRIAVPVNIVAGRLKKRE